VVAGVLTGFDGDATGCVARDCADFGSGGVPPLGAEASGGSAGVVEPVLPEPFIATLELPDGFT
jgi:hypothetical protein